MKFPYIEQPDAMDCKKNNPPFFLPLKIKVLTLQPFLENIMSNLLKQKNYKNE
jgi:hypothetical protein